MTGCARRVESSGRSDAGAPAVVPSEAAISSARPRSASHWIARIAIRSAFSGLHRLNLDFLSLGTSLRRPSDRPPMYSRGCRFRGWSKITTGVGRPNRPGLW